MVNGTAVTEYLKNIEHAISVKTYAYSIKGHLRNNPLKDPIRRKVIILNGLIPSKHCLLDMHSLISLDDYALEYFNSLNFFKSFIRYNKEINEFEERLESGE